MGYFVEGQVAALEKAELEMVYVFYCDINHGRLGSGRPQVSFGTWSFDYGSVSDRIATITAPSIPR